MSNISVSNWTLEQWTVSTAYAEQRLGEVELDLSTEQIAEAKAESAFVRRSLGMQPSKYDVMRKAWESSYRELGERMER